MLELYNIRMMIVSSDDGTKTLLLANIDDAFLVY